MLFCAPDYLLRERKWRNRKSKTCRHAQLVNVRFRFHKPVESEVCALTALIYAHTNQANRYRNELRQQWHFEFNAAHSDS